MIEIKRWFWNDKEVSKEEHEELDTDWKRTVIESERKLNDYNESSDKPKRKKK